MSKLFLKYFVFKGMRELFILVFYNKKGISQSKLSVKLNKNIFMKFEIK